MKPYLVAPEAEDDLKLLWRYLLGEAGLALANRIQSDWWMFSKAWPMFPARAIGVPT